MLYNLFLFQILTICVFLLIAFSLSFIIQFKSKTPFENPWAVFVETMDMLTSEYDYKDLFNKNHFNDSVTFLIIVTVIFQIFLIVIPIVLMNLVVGYNNDEVHGNIRRLAKQVEFLGTLNTIINNKVLSTVLPRVVNRSIKNKSNVVKNFNLYPGKPRSEQYEQLPSRLQDTIFNKALIQDK